VHAAFDASAIDTRHTVITELADGGSVGGGIFVAEDGHVLPTSTGTRNAIYAEEAPALFAAAAQEALTIAGVTASEVTHVVTASCTGFFAPGPDYRLVRDLGLPLTTERYHLGFLGCAAAFPALRAAARICAAQPEAVVLVACGELCTLHIRPSPDPEQIVASSVFGDGAAAAVVTALPARSAGPTLEMERFGTAITSEGESDMVWVIGDEGFEMTLTAEVPRIIGREIRGAVERFLAADDTDAAAIAAWAVHPGGRSVLDRVEAGLALPQDALDASRQVLREHGNMSSATILFILQSLMNDAALAAGDRLAGLAFGPGLTVESALFTKHIPDPA
jgi:predicted naringenin-chalcone synthase